jgi:hypothetical protein
MGVSNSTPLMRPGVNKREKAHAAPPVDTRYFSFTRVNPKISDYDALVKTCNRVDAYLSYTTVRCGEKTRLFGIIVLRGPPTIADDIGRLFPNFNLTPMTGEFDANFERLMGVTSGDDVIQHNEHPFFSLRRALFRDPV